MDPERWREAAARGRHLSSQSGNAFPRAVFDARNFSGDVERAMTNPLNPLNWLRLAQDWFRKTERSSGFRPYLIFLLITAGVSFSLLSFFRDVPGVVSVALWLLATSAGGFIVLFAVKAFQEPEFCRSEVHVERMARLELEAMGSEDRILPAEIVEEAPAVEAPPEAPGLPGSAGEGGAAE